MILIKSYKLVDSICSLAHCILGLVIKQLVRVVGHMEMSSPFVNLHISLCMFVILYVNFEVFQCFAEMNHRKVYGSLMVFTHDARLEHSILLSTLLIKFVCFSSSFLC